MTRYPVALGIIACSLLTQATLSCGKKKDTDDRRQGEPATVIPGTKPPETPGSPPLAPGVLPSDPILAEMMQAHNYYRERHGLKPLVWDNNLEAAAKTHANRCVFRHTDAQTERYRSPTLGISGENLHMTTGTLSSGVNACFGFASEIKNWTCPTAKCAPGTMCGHYTQMVWATTTNLGCAYTKCPTQTIVVCSYLPAGNWANNKGEIEPPFPQSMCGKFPPATSQYPEKVTSRLDPATLLK